MFKIPEKIKIGGCIIDVKRLLASDMDGSFGTYSSWKSEIKIAKDIDIHKSQVRISFIHEILEHLNAKHEYNLPHPTITSLAENIYQILMDNFIKEK